MNGAKAHAAVTIPPKPTAPLASYIGKLVLVPTSLVDPMPNQPRTHFDRVKLKALELSISSVGQQEAGTIVPWKNGRFQLRDGERRFRCCANLAIPFLTNVATAGTVEEEYELAGIANFLREGHSPYEKSLYIRRLKDGALKRSVADIAQAMGISTATVYNHLSILEKLSKEALWFLDPKNVDRPLQFMLATELTSLHAFPIEQAQIARKLVERRLPLAAGRQLIERESLRLGVKKGRGRERKPSDHLANFRTALSRLDLALEKILSMSQREIDDMFRRLPSEQYQDVLLMVDHRLDSLTEVRDALRAVRSKSTPHLVSAS